MIYPHDYDKIVTIKKEPHYVWPHKFVDGNSTMCADCRYFVPDLKSKLPFTQTGHCHSMASNTERGYVHSKNWDVTSSNNSSCKWWFPIEKQPGEQAELPEEKDNGEA